MNKKRPQETPLTQVEDPEELKRRYRMFSDQVLRRWSEVIVGPHREAISAILQERENAGKEEG